MASEPLLPERAERAQILLATRSADVVRRVRAAIAEEIDVVEIADVGQVQAAFETSRPMLALVDVDTSAAWGLVMCGALRASSGAGPLRMLVLARADDVASIREAYGHGAFDFVDGTAEGAALRERLRFAMRTARAMADAHQNKLRLTRVQRIAHLGSWMRDLASGQFSADAEVLRIFQLDTEVGDAPGLLDAMLARVHEGDRERVKAAMSTCRPHRVDYRIAVGKPGQSPVVRTVQQEAWLTQDEANGDVQLIGTVLDVSELKETQARVARMAFVDALTGLPNRAFLRAHLEQVLARAHRYDRKFALMMLDLDMFKRINDTLGHAAGDTLLETIARRVARAVRASDVVIRPASRDVCAMLPTDQNTVARLGGDEFIVVLNELKDPADAAVVARRILESVGQPVDLDGTTLVPACSIGIAVFPDNGTSAELLLKQADTALYHVKEQGRGSYHFFSEALTQRADQRMKIEVGLRSALAERGLLLHYQPKVELATRRVTGVEALVRWPTADGRFVPPDQFIPVAEDIGLIGELGRWVLRTACAQAAEWSRSLPVPVPVAVNVSGRQLEDPAFDRIVAEVLAETQLPARLLELEVTEGFMMKDIRAGASMLAKIKARGVRIAIDDFGTGYSSLSCLTRLPIDTLKIDRAFVRELGVEVVSGSIVVAILALCRALSLRVVAEGVETAEHATALKRYGCGEAQGYLFARPMPPEDCARWITSAPRPPAARRPRTTRAAPARSRSGW